MMKCRKNTISALPSSRAARLTIAAIDANSSAEATISSAPLRMSVRGAAGALVTGRDHMRDGRALVVHHGPPGFA